MNRPRAAVLCLAAVLLNSCAGKEAAPPVPKPEPVSSLRYESIEGQDLNHLSFSFALEAENTGGEAAGIFIESWSAAVDGRELETAAVLESEGLSPIGGLPSSALTAGEKRSFPLKLDLDLEEFLKNPPQPQGPEGDSELVFQVKLVYRYPSSGRVNVALRTRVHFPLVREPQFLILSIGIKRAELINTRFLVKISVNNPNVFPVDLSAFSYELYNGGQYWAGGNMQNVLSIPPESSAEAELFLVMNFIDMQRSLLDEIIARRHVDYRFAGTAMVNTGVAFLPRFQWVYDKSGRSAVTD
jgi:LEA14-like dessication related protein